MRLSDAGLRQRQTKAVNPDHRLPPWLTEDAASDRSNRLLGGDATPTTTLARLYHGISQVCLCSAAGRLLSELRHTGIEHEIQDRTVPRVGDRRLHRDMDCPALRQRGKSRSGYTWYEELSLE